MMQKSDFFYNRKGEPVFLTGLQCHNSSVGTELIDSTIQAIHLYGGNLLEAPVYWCEVEAEEDCYDFSMVKTLVDKAKAAGLYLIPLWFGASKNGLFTYAPDYIKRNVGVYKRARNSAGIPVESLSPHCRATLDRDKKVFSKVMEFLAGYDREGTVIAVQIENEIGLAHTDRDYSKEAEAEYRQPVAKYLWDVKLKDSGVGEESTGTIDPPTWKGLFGRHANEAFSAWKHACYIQEMVEAGLEKYGIPYIMNVSIEINEYEEPGLCYISGGPVARVLDIWKKTAPGIKLFGPDIYLPAERDYRKACEAYARPDNPLFIPESLIGGIGAALNMMIAVADYAAIGICCFGAESGIADGKLLPEAEQTAISMRAIASLAPLLIRYRGTGRIHAVTQAEFSGWQYVKTEDYHVTARFLSNDPKPQHYFGSRINTNDPKNASCLTDRGRCLLVDCGDGEFYVAGAGVCLTFLRRPEVWDDTPYAHLASALSGQLNFLSVEEGHFEGNTWIREYRRNGDEANYQLYVHPGQVVRVRLNPDIKWEE
ncbi:MAG TPA: DUF5597 domain-containing protein [Clostridiales bacterium]|nr:DUF5597 domain-containing protein [Clostridiales bacterium]